MNESMYTGKHVCEFWLGVQKAKGVNLSQGEPL